MRTIDFITQDDWLEKAEKFPVAFAQVREDSRIDVWLAERIPNKARGIMVASGGCTAAHLAHTGKFTNLTLVDMNPAQLELARLKLFLLQNGTKSERMELLGYADINASQRKEGLLKLFDANSVHKNTFGDFDTLASIGLDYSGRYELLFARLQERLKNIPANNALFQLDDAIEQKRFLKENPDYLVALKDVFTEVMHLDNLVRLFGKEATQNSIKPFSLHFLERTIAAIETLPAASNPYLAQLLQGKFHSKEYEWLSLPNQTLETEIQFVNSSMLDALSKGKEKYDFIHLSNILDWLDHQQATQLLYAASQKLAHGGQLVIRQLNSSLQIPNLCPDLFWQPDIASDLHNNDRSFFYQKIHVATSYASN